MINELNAMSFCKDDIKNIENYDKAKVDTSQTWVCHHRLETCFLDGSFLPFNVFFSVEDLIRLRLYYNRPANELIFLTKSEHRKTHCKVQNNWKPQYGNQYTKGKHHSEESKKKISGSQKKVVHTEDWNKKVGLSQKCYWDNISEEAYKIRCDLNKKASEAAAKKSVTEKQISARKRNMSLIAGSNKGKKWYNNGVENHFYIEGQQPEGYVLGLIKKEKNNAGKYSRENENTLQ